MAGEYKFERIFYPQMANDMITFVKKTLDNQLIVFDRQGWGEIFDLPLTADSPRKFEFHGDTFSFSDVFMCNDSNNRPLVVACTYHNSKLFVWDMLNYRYPAKTTLNYQFRLWQTVDKCLIICNIATKEFNRMELDWDIVETWRELSGTDSPFKQTPIDNTRAIWVYNDGVIVDANMLQSRGFQKVDANKFDIDSISNDNAKWFRIMLDDTRERRMPSICCYHNTKDEYYLGHDGSISIWKRKIAEHDNQLAIENVGSMTH
jgi:hypothetical protein